MLTNLISFTLHKVTIWWSDPCYLNLLFVIKILFCQRLHIMPFGKYEFRLNVWTIYSLDSGQAYVDWVQAQRIVPACRVAVSPSAIAR
jgi:hypothetical protein